MIRIPSSASLESVLHNVQDTLKRPKHLVCASFFLENYWHSVLYLKVMTQRSKLTLGLVPLIELDTNDDPVLLATKTMEEIGKLEAEVIILYTKTGNIELMLLQVMSCRLLIIVSTSSRFHLRLQDEK